MSSNAGNYGQFYWCVKVDKSLSQNGEIYLYADKVEITPTGDLVFYAYRPDRDPNFSYNLALAAGRWITFFAASVMDGAACAVEHWKGEVISDDED